MHKDAQSVFVGMFFAMSCFSALVNTLCAILIVGQKPGLKTIQNHDATFQWFEL